MNKLYVGWALLLCSCLPVKKSSLLLSENSGGICYDSTNDVSQNSDLVFKQRYNYNKEYDLYESLAFIEKNIQDPTTGAIEKRAFLVTSSEKSNSTTYEIDITDSIRNADLESAGNIEATEQYKKIANVEGLSGMSFASNAREVYLLPDHNYENKLFKSTIGETSAPSVSTSHVVINVDRIGDRHQDWEDVEVDKCPNSNERCIFISNLGDNGHWRSTKDKNDELEALEAKQTKEDWEVKKEGELKDEILKKGYSVYWFEESKFVAGGIVNANVINVSYEDGSSQNSEGMSIHDGYIYVTTKKHDGKKNVVWKTKLNSDNITLAEQCELPIVHENGDYGWSDVTATDIFNFEGETYFAVRDYQYIYVFRGLPK